MNEALRLHPAAPASLQRETPAEGRTLNGFYVPAKVGLQSHSKGNILILPPDYSVHAMLHHTARPQRLPTS